MWCERCACLVQTFAFFMNSSSYGAVSTTFLNSVDSDQGEITVCREVTGKPETDSEASEAGLAVANSPAGRPRSVRPVRGVAFSSGEGESAGRAPLADRAVVCGMGQQVQCRLKLLVTPEVTASESDPSEFRRLSWAAYGASVAIRTRQTVICGIAVDFRGNCGREGGGDGWT